MANEGDILRSLSPEVVDFDRGERTEGGKDVSRATISQSPISFEVLRRPILATGRGSRRAPSFIGTFDEALEFFEPLPEPEPEPEPVLTGTSQFTQLSQDPIGGDRDPAGDPENVSGLSTVGDAELFGTPNTLGPVAPVVGTPAFRSATEATAMASRGAAPGSGGASLGNVGATGAVSASPAGRAAETGIGQGGGPSGGPSGGPGGGSQGAGAGAGSGGAGVGSGVGGAPGGTAGGGGQGGDAAGGPSGGPGGAPGDMGGAEGAGTGGTAGGGGDPSGGCVVTTALNDMGAFTDTEKRVAVDWCRRTHHDGSRRGRAWVRGYHVWGGIVAKVARRWPLFRRLVRYTTSRFVDHATGRDRNPVGFAIHTLIVTPFSYLIGALSSDKHPRI